MLSCHMSWFSDLAYHGLIHDGFQEHTGAKTSEDDMTTDAQEIFEKIEEIAKEQDVHNALISV